MTVTYGKSQRVGGIVGLRYLFKLQYTPCHIHNLLFFRLSVPYDSLLYLQRRIFKNRDAVSYGGKHYYSARLSHVYGGFLIICKKQSGENFSKI